MPVKFKLPSPSSNKSALLDAREIAYWVKREKEKVAVLRPKIDKVSITYSMWDLTESHAEMMKLQQHVEQALWDAADQDVSAFKPAPLGKSPSRYKTNIIWHGTPSEGGILIQAHPKSKKVKHFFRFEFNPSTLSKASIAGFFEEWAELSIQAGSLEDILKNGTITRLDIAVDVVGVSIFNLLFRGGEAHKSFAYFAESGPVQSVYLNYKPKKKPSDTKGYNKRKELEETGKLPAYGGIPYSRIEVTRKTALPIPKLGTLPNKLMGISVASPNSYRPEGMESQTWTWFLDSVRHRGEKAALATVIDASLRSEIETCLNEAHADLWRPQDIWKFWPEALKAAQLTLDD
ncbi:hypothetical protein [Microvirga flavescens]|uniref:hypothetical protein n=1 Tax=Microvirga flavescens TaxID=2249811 RepID=UPI000DD9A17C|nr:hypothetical protein [Microvirga flavescens]